MPKIDGTEKVETISLEMTWRDTLPLLLTVYADGSAKGRADCLKELQRMAHIADQYVADHKAEQKAEKFQLLELLETPTGKRWHMVAHGAAYGRAEADAAQTRIEARGGIVRRLPC